MVSEYVKLATIVESNQKAPFSIATTLDGSTLLMIRTLYWLVLRKEEWSTIFKVFDMTRHGIKPSSPGPLVNTLLTRPMSRFGYGK